jgi:hypothetical protein
MIKTSEGTDKYAGKFRLCRVTGDGAITTDPPDGNTAAVLFEAADRQSLYQNICLDQLDEQTRNYVWVKLHVLLENIELKRKRFYGENGELVEYASS